MVKSKDKFDFKQGDKVFVTIKVFDTHQLITYYQLTLILPYFGYLHFPDNL